MSTPTSPPPAGWYPDPQGGDGQRWWNGVAWSDQTRPAAPAQPTEPASTQAPYTSAQQAYPGAQQAYPGAQQAYGGYAAAPPIGAWQSPVDDRPVVTNPVDAVRTIFQKYARFEGRASRPEFWWWILANFLVAAACYVVGIVLIVAAGASSGYGNSGAAVFSVIGGLLMLLLVAWEIAVLVPSLAVLVRRLRDAGFHWGFIFLSLVPGGSIAVLVMCCMPSKYP